MNINFETDCDKVIATLIKKVFDEVSLNFRLPKKVEIMISFLTEEEIKEVNLNARNIDKVTDVLSFPYLSDIYKKKIVIKNHKQDINPFTKNLMLGEINICMQRAKEQAKDYGHSLQRECAYLALHGFLHILGYDHIEFNDKQIMRTKEEEILNKLDIKR